jgi:hypothetical protein
MQVAGNEAPNSTADPSPRSCCYLGAHLAVATVVDLRMLPLCERVVRAARSINATLPCDAYWSATSHNDKKSVIRDINLPSMVIFPKYSVFLVRPARGYCISVVALFGLGPESGSGFKIARCDGDQHFLPLRVPVPGIEPAAKRAEAAPSATMARADRFAGMATLTLINRIAQR